MSEALDILYNDNDVEQIFIEPPEIKILTDEDSGDENGSLIDNLSCHQLQTPAEIKLAGNVKYSSVDSDNGDVQFRTSSKDVAKNAEKWFRKRRTGKKSFECIKRGGFRRIAVRFPLT